MGLLLEVNLDEASGEAELSCRRLHGAWRRCALPWQLVPGEHNCQHLL